jgi:MSHA biogenesis protein MshN
MSLLNDVLKDLERRGGSPGGAAVATGPAEPARRRRGVRRTLVTAALLGVSIGSLAYALRTVAPPELGVTAPVGAGAGAGAEAEAPVVAAPELVGLSLEPVEGAARLRVELRGVPAYRLDRGDGDATVLVVLEGTRLAEALPPLDLADTPLAGIDTRSEGADLELVLTTASGVRVQSSMLAQEDRSEVVLWLSAPAEPAPALAEVPAAPEPTSGAVERVAALPSAESAHREARRLLAAGRIEAALERLRELLEAEPEHRGARLTLARTLAAEGLSGEALRVLEAGRALAPSHAPFAKLEARLLTEHSELEAAIETLEAALPPVAEDPEYHAFLAALLQRRGDHARAAELFAGALREQGRHAAWWMGLGISLEAAERDGEALAAFRRSLALERLEPAARRWVQARERELAAR